MGQIPRKHIAAVTLIKTKESINLSHPVWLWVCAGWVYFSFLICYTASTSMWMHKTGSVQEQYQLEGYLEHPQLLKCVTSSQPLWATPVLRDGEWWAHTAPSFGCIVVSSHFQNFSKLWLCICTSLTFYRCLSKHLAHNINTKWGEIRYPHPIVNHFAIVRYRSWKTEERKYH